MDRLDERKRALQRWNTLKKDREQGWDSHWKSIANNLLPRQSRFFTDSRNRGGDRNQDIIDSAGTRALRTLSAGMMAGMTSPARPWFRLSLPDEDLAATHNVKVWLDDVTKLLLRIFRKSNTYNALHFMYRELGGFGTGLSVVQPNFDRIIHHNTMTVGEYALGTSHEGYVDKLGREFKLTVEQAIQWFGYNSVSATTRNAYDNGNYSREISVMHLLQPNTNREPGKRDKYNMAYKSCYWDAKESDGPESGLLSEGGYRDFPALGPRWDVLWGDTYGSSPGMDALGDLLQLQHNQRAKAKVIDYQTDPPLQAPLALRNQNADFLPGGVSYYDSAQPQGGVRTAFDVKLDPNVLLEDIRDVRERINSAFFADMFLMIAQADKNMTATEVAERHEEKLLMLGPVLERLHNELLDPMVTMTFQRCVETGILPPLPEELNGQELQVEFVSMLAQAQKAVNVNAVDRLVGHIGMLAQASGDPSGFDKFDGDKSIERYADQLGVDPDLIVSDDKVALVRQQRAQAIAQQQQAEMAEKLAGAAGKLGGVQTGGAPENNAGADILNLFSGYQSPSATEI
jgi:hypothetical protein